MDKTSVERAASQRETIHRALCVLSDEMLIDLVAFCRTHEEYRQSDLHQMAQDVLRSRRNQSCDAKIHTRDGAQYHRRHWPKLRGKLGDFVREPVPQQNDNGKAIDEVGTVMRLFHHIDFDGETL
jgi:hypothetical protein